MELLIRNMTMEDAAAVNVLSHQLGYPLSPRETEERMRAVLSLPDRCSYVIVMEEKVVGWIHAFIALGIESRPFVEIGGLVVDEAFRGRGLGRLLIREVEQWTREQNIPILRLRTNRSRSEAHQFYRNLGFTEIKEQKVFELTVFDTNKEAT